MTFEECLALEAHDQLRREWVDGQVYVKAGGTERHDLLAGLVYEALAGPARSRGCRPFIQNRRVRSGEVAYYPDVLVVCPGARRPDRLYERECSIVVEVLSPSTERTDRHEKAHAYAAAPSFEAYVLVDPDRRRVEVGTPADAGLQWQVHAGGHVPELGTSVEALYDALDQTALT